MITEKLKVELQRLGRNVSDGMPAGWGFALLLFDATERPGGAMLLSTNTVRKEETIEAIKELLRREGETSLLPRRNGKGLI